MNKLALFSVLIPQKEWRLQIQEQLKDIDQLFYRAKRYLGTKSSW